MKKQPTHIDGFADEIVSYVNSKIPEYTKKLEKAASNDLFAAYKKITTNILAPRVVTQAASQIRGGILVSADNSPQYVHGISLWSKNKYGIPISVDEYRTVNGKTYHITSALQITASNRLDLAWRQGITGTRILNRFPAFSLNYPKPPGWRNPDFRKVTPVVTLGTKTYAGLTPENTLISYIDDLVSGSNEGVEFGETANSMILDILKHM